MTTTGYMTSYSATFQIEGVDRDTALRMARTIRDRLDQAFHEIVAETAEISAGTMSGPHWAPQRQATSADGRKAITRIEASPFGLEEYDA